MVPKRTLAELKPQGLYVLSVVPITVLVWEEARLLNTQSNKAEIQVERVVLENLTSLLFLLISLLLFLSFAYF